MSSVTVARLRSHLAECLEKSQNEPLILLRHGRPIAIIKGVKCDNDADEKTQELVEVLRDGL